MICLERSNKATTIRNDSIRVHDTLPLNEGAMACIPFRFSHWVGFVMICVGTLCHICPAGEDAGLYFLARRWGKYMEPMFLGGFIPTAFALRILNSLQ